MQTAYYSDKSFNLTFFLPSPKSYFFAIYYAEISPNVTMPGQRVFTVQVFNASNDLYGDKVIDLFQLSGNVSYNSYMTRPISPIYVGPQGFIDFNFTKTDNSMYGPLICGLEIRQIFDHDMSLGTDNSEVNILQNITAVFPSLKSWTGDPCLPFAYDWLSCSSDLPPSISAILLDNYDLEGQIPPGFNQFKNLVHLSLAENKLVGSIPNLGALQYLQVLDLHANKLNGSIPDFLAELPSLTVLNLDNNNFSGGIPENLRRKASSSGLQFSIAGNPYLCNPASDEEFCNTGVEKKSNGALVGGLAAVGGVAALVVIGVLTVCIVRHKKKLTLSAKGISQQIKTKDNADSVLPQRDIINSSNQAQQFSYSSIKEMTKNFERKIGKGGFGPVYHGVLPNGKQVAVKLLANDSQQGEQQFMNEVELLCQVHHRNLVSLVGYCVETQLILVYEYMANGSLFDALKGGGAVLNAWIDRLRVAVDAANGLDYLHNGSNPSIIHRDVKSSNILLDENFVAQISDFGISKAKKYKTSTMTESQKFTAVQGSLGYLDPEYAATNIANHSIDVYAFGIVLFEIITGKPALIQSTERPGQPQHILQWVKHFVEKGDIAHLIDPVLANRSDMTSIWQVIDTAMRCVEHHQETRPRINEVQNELQSALSFELKNNVYNTKSTGSQKTLIKSSFASSR